eukprot:CAMPEP_0116898178 /NCGR_PEP_ID=MMETSP0467-20121206/6943_1 /TAXON_ID=283647 /ORGANISM="Mesodinium pulex, Strain SPMC105" /LENGTH=186 /DNA_ID=CAMNT_0004570131 /DNA_START=1374 /DNA_END=1934 /DNA_ORIENTATION=-
MNDYKLNKAQILHHMNATGKEYNSMTIDSSLLESHSFNNQTPSLNVNMSLLEQESEGDFAGIDLDANGSNADVDNDNDNDEPGCVQKQNQKTFGNRSKSKDSSIHSDFVHRMLNEGENDDIHFGFKIVCDSCFRPLSKILENAYETERDVMGRVISDFDATGDTRMGFDLLGGEYCDLVDAGIVDA